MPVVWKWSKFHTFQIFVYLINYSWGVVKTGTVFLIFSFVSSFIVGPVKNYVCHDSTDQLTLTKETNFLKIYLGICDNKINHTFQTNDTYNVHDVNSLATIKLESTVWIHDR